MLEYWCWRSFVWLALTCALSACAGEVVGGSADGDQGSHGSDAGGAAGDAAVPLPGRGDGSVIVDPGKRDGGGSIGTGSDAGGISIGTPGDVCDAPIGLVDTSHPTTVVGSGAGTCSESLLEAAIKKGGIITFDCGDDATIALDSEKVLPGGMDTTIDGNGKITLDGQSKTRILSFNGMDFQKGTSKITLQRLRLINGKAQGSMMFASASAPCSQGYKDGSGGAVLVRDADLRIIDSKFENNQSALLGPDVGGGAVYVLGSIATTVVGSTFTANKGSNGGALGSLFGNLTVYNSTFADNQATGNGANSDGAFTGNDECPDVDGQKQVGSGGNGGAIVIDGGEKFSVVVCGSTFRHNLGGQGAFGGAMFRTPDVDVQKTNIERSSFLDNESGAAGALYFHHSQLTIDSSTFSGNIGHDGTGAIQVDDTVLSILNSTFVQNKAQRDQGGAGPRGGAITHFGGGTSSGSIRSSTFVGNAAASGNGSAGGALSGASMFSVEDSLFVDNQPSCDASGNGEANLQWPAGGTSCVQGIMSMDPQLGSLQDNGGPTPTVLPASGSPAAKSGKSCPDKDQRGYARSGACTLGAVEVGASGP